MHFTMESMPAFASGNVSDGRIPIKHHQADKGSITLTIYNNNFIFDINGHNHENPHGYTDGNNYININGLGEAHQPGDGRYITNGKISDYSEKNFYNFAESDNKSAFDTVYFRDKNSMIIFDDPLNPPPSGWLNPLEEAFRSVFYIKETSALPLYFWVIDEIQKDPILTAEYDWHIITKSYNVINATASQEVNIQRATGASERLDIYVAQPSNPTFETSTINQLSGSSHTGGEKLSIKYTAVVGDYSVLLIPNNSTTRIHNYITPSMTNGSGVVVDWDANFDDHCYYSRDNNIQSNDINSNASKIFIRKNLNSSSIESYFQVDGSQTTFESIALIELFGQSGTVSVDETTIEIEEANITDFKIYAPEATIVKVNGQSSAFYRVNDYVYSPTISANETWDGDVYISGDVTVDGGYTVTATSGTIIEFAPSAKLISNGDLSWVGTQLDSIFVRANTSSIGFGVQIKKLGDPQNSPIGTFEYCSFKDLATGVEVVNSDLSLKNSLIKDTQKGVTLINAGTAVIENTAIRYASIGINVDGCSPSVTDNEIIGCGLGVSVVSGAGSYFENTISYCGQGPLDNLPGAFYASSGATPILQRTANSLNQLTSNTGFGLKAYNRSTIFAGDGDLYGNNNIYSNGVDAEATFNSIIWGINNYWGTEEPASTQFNADASSVISYSPFLSGPATNFTSPKISPGKAKFAESSNVEENNEDLERPKLSLTEWQKQLFMLFRTKEYSTVLSMGDSLLLDGLSEEHAFFTLTLMQQSSLASSDSSFISYLTTYSATASSAQKQLLSGFLLEQYLKHQQYTLFNNKAQEIQTTYNGTQAEAFAHFKLFHYGLYHLGSKTAAEQALGSLQNEFPTNELTYLATQQWQTAVSGESQKRTRPIKTARRGEKIVVIESYSLSQNYPNPFNPTTTIEYALPERSEVTITIYDVIGQQIQTLVADRVSPVGNFQVVWNGKNDAGNRVASGVYIYQLTAVSLETGSQHTINKKMTLMR